MTTTREYKTLSSENNKNKHEISFTHHPSPTASKNLKQLRISNKIYNGLANDSSFISPLKEQALMIEHHYCHGDKIQAQKENEQLDEFIEKQKQEISYKTQRHFKASSPQPLKPIEKTLKFKNNKSKN